MTICANVVSCLTYEAKSWLSAICTEMPPLGTIKACYVRHLLLISFHPLFCSTLFLFFFRGSLNLSLPLLNLPLPSTLQVVLTRPLVVLLIPSHLQLRRILGMHLPRHLPRHPTDRACHLIRKESKGLRKIADEGTPLDESLGSTIPGDSPTDLPRICLLYPYHDLYHLDQPWI
jgi:hypothetical protein